MITANIIVSKAIYYFFLEAMKKLKLLHTLRNKFLDKKVANGTAKR
jgi:hypothetical protein